jgi:hypothetical protein
VPVDARNISSELKGFRTFFTSFHHLGPEDAKQVLQDAVSKRTGIGIFESTRRDLFAFLWMLLLPITVWITTPWIRPFSIKRLLFTYLLPIVPLVLAWDGLVSCWRTYSCSELRQLTARLGSSYKWNIGEIRGNWSPVPITYLIGLPLDIKTHL